MATFNKRGYKAPKEKEDKGVNTFVDDIEQVNVDEKDSATAKAFDTLDQSASKAEDFVAKNQKVILGFLTVVAIATVSYLLYQKFVAEPNQDTAANELFVAQQNFQKAVDGGEKADSLYNLNIRVCSLVALHCSISPLRYLSLKFFSNEKPFSSFGLITSKITPRTSMI